MKCRKTTTKHEKAKVCRVYLAHFTKHLFRISYFIISLEMAFFWWNIKGFLKRIKISWKCRKMYRISHFFFCELPWNAAWNRKCDKYVASLKVHFDRYASCMLMKHWERTMKYEKSTSVWSMCGAFHRASFSHFIFHVISLKVAVYWWNIKGFLSNLV